MTTKVKLKIDLHKVLMRSTTQAEKQYCILWGEPYTHTSIALKMLLPPQED